MPNPTGAETAPRTAASENSSRYLTKDQLADRTRFSFKEEDVELPEIGGMIRVKQMNLQEREELPDLADENGKAIPDPDKKRLATLFASIVVEPRLSVEEARETIVTWPAEAVDKVIIAFGKMTGTKEEAVAAAAEFRSSND
jgi:hypothetical protein